MSIGDPSTDCTRQLDAEQASVSQESLIAAEDLTVSDQSAASEPSAVADDQPRALNEKVSRDAATLRNALAFTQMIGVLMRSGHYRRYTLGDLEWLVIPPLLAGQFRIGEVRRDKNQGPAIPVAVVLWASVSEEVDKRLMGIEESSFRLKPEEWKSGDIIWLVHAAGETRFVRHLVDELTKTTLKGRQVKVLGRDQAGKPKLHVLGAAAVQT